MAGFKDFLLKITAQSLLAVALALICFDTSCAAKKKEIFIPGPTKEYMARAPYWDSKPEPEKTKHFTEIAALAKLIELYAKEHTLPTLAEHQKNLEQFEKSCEHEDQLFGRADAAETIRGVITTLTASERLEKLSPKELQTYYEKIKTNPNEYQSVSEIFDEGFPPFSELLIDNIGSVLFRTWIEQEEAALKKESLETLKQNSVYLKYVKTCKDRRTASSTPTLWAFDDLILNKAKQLVQAMSNGQVKKYYESHSDVFGGDPFSMNDIVLIRRQIAYRMRDELSLKTLRPIAQKYTFKSDSPEVLAYIEELKSGKDQS